MKVIFFSDCKTLDEVKQLYKTLAKQHHPDKGGDLETMKQINAEYDFVSVRLLKGMDIKEEERTRQTAFSQTYKEKINAIIHLEGVIVELSGSWIWVTGNTRPIKDKLKEAGFFWAKNKCAWFWRPEDQKCNNRKPLTMEEIRRKYGSERINSDQDNNLLKAAS